MLFLHELSVAELLKSFNEPLFLVCMRAVMLDYVHMYSHCTYCVGNKATSKGSKRQSGGDVQEVQGWRVTRHSDQAL